MISKRLDEIILPRIAKFLNERARVTVLAGSRSSGKTLTVALYVCLYMISQKNASALVIREEATNFRDSIYEDFKNAAMILGIYDPKNFHLAPLSISMPNGNKVIFKGAKKSKSAKGTVIAGQKFLFLIIEEAQNIEDYEQVNILEKTAFRGQEERYTIIIMNTDVRNWVYDIFYKRARFEPKIGPLETIGFMSKRYKEQLSDTATIDWNLGYFSIYGNKFLTKEDLEEYEIQKTIDPEGYLVDALGMWGNVGGAIYTHCKNGIILRELTPENTTLFEECFVIDYGEQDGATTCLHAAYSKNYKYIYLINLYYWKNRNMGYKNAMEFENDIFHFIDSQAKKWKTPFFTGIVDSAAEVFRINILRRLEAEGYRKFIMYPTLNQNGTPGKFDILTRIQLGATLMSQRRIIINSRSSNFQVFLDEIERAVWDENKTKKVRKGGFDDCLDTFEYFIMNRYKTLSSSKWRENVSEKILLNSR